MTWFLKLAKRLYKRISFIIIMILVPLSAAAVSFASGQSHGLVSVALVGGDGVAEQIKAELTEQNSLIRFEKMSYDDAKKALATSRVDAVWVFYDDTEERISRFAKNGPDSGEVATVMVREQTTLMRLTNEKLSGAIFKQVAKQKYLDFAKSTLDGQYTDSELMEFYDSTAFSGNLFKTVSVSKKQTDTSYLVSPLRGLLSVLCVVSGLAACIYVLKDRQVGTFSRLTKDKRFFAETASIFIAVASTAAVAVVSLAAAGSFSNILYELLTAAVSTLAVTSFCAAALNVLPTLSRLGAAIPLIVIASLTAAPVFITLSFTKIASLLLPTTYYLLSAYRPIYILYALVYTVAAFAVSHFTYKIKE